MRKHILIVAAILLLPACATGYQIDGFTGGQTAKWRATDVLEVQASGNAMTSDSKLSKMTLLRAAETAIQADYRYFIEIGSQNTGGVDTYYTPRTTTTNVNAYATGSSVSGYSTTYSSGGPVSYYKPGVNAVYRMYGELPHGARSGQFYDAYAIYNHLGPKYIRKFKAKQPPSD